jgi:predicted esterase
MAMATFLKIQDMAPGGVICFIGMNLLDYSEIDIDWELKKETPILLVNGLTDAIFPIEYAQLSYKFLEDKGLDYELIELEDTGHAITADMRSNLKQFIETYQN